MTAPRRYPVPWLALLVAALLPAAGCSRNAAPPRPAAGEESAGAAPPAGGVSHSAAGVTWTVPARWQVGADRPMRVATYRIPAAAGDPEDGECSVFYFGAGQGGSVEANLERWFGQIVQEDGRPTAEVARRDRRAIGGVAVTTVDMSGTYLFSPTPMSPERTPKPGFRMRGAIVEAPGGNVFFKLTAPGATAAAAVPEFEAMLQSLRRG